MSYTYAVMTVENAKDRRYDSGTGGKAGLPKRNRLFSSIAHKSTGRDGELLDI